MTQETFKNDLIKLLQQKLGDCATVDAVTINKVNHHYDGIVIKTTDSNVSPTFSIQEYYLDYIDGNRTLNDIVTEILRINYAPEKNHAITLSKKLFDLAWVKSNVQLKVINYEKNLSYLENVPFRKFLDLAIIPYVAISTQTGQGSITIHNEYLDELGIDIQELFQAARINMNQKKAVIRNLEDILIEIMIENGYSKEDATYCIQMETSKNSNIENPIMYVISNEEQINGSQMILKDGVFKELSELLGSKQLYVMPSSLHELICISSNGADPQQLHEMVCSINSSEVSIKDFLSDSVYFYDAEKDEFAIAA